MNNRNSILAGPVCGLTAAASLIVGVSVPGNVEAAERESEQSSLSLEEIVVTAQRRAERLQNVPISISVLETEYLDSARAQGVSELLGRVPGVAVNESVPSGRQVAIRGVSAFAAAGAGASPVAYYLDTIPFGLIGGATSPDASAYDLERVEVLRGPQGTLYGMSALNGVVRVLTKDANPDEFEFKTRLETSSTEDGGMNYRSDAAINVPVIEDKLGVRAVAGYQDLSGWIDKPNLPQEDANSAEILNMRLKVNAQPTENLSIGASAWLGRNDYDAQSLSRNGEPTHAGFLREPISNDFDAYGLTMGYQFSSFSVVSTTSYLDYASDAVLDLSVSGPVVRFQHAVGTTRTFAQEINLSSTNSASWRWSAGGIYRDSKDRTSNDIPGLFPAPARGFTTSESFAVFGELTRIWMDGRFELTGGLRYFEDEVQQTDITSTVTPPNEGRVTTFDSLSPRVVLNWHPHNAMTLYASYAEGFRSGSDQDLTVQAVAPETPPAEPDTLHNYEVGLKGNTPSGVLAYEAAVYFIDWQDALQRVLLETSPGVFRNVIINAESASGLGVDLALAVTPLRGLTLGMNYNWNELAMDRDVFSRGVALIREGERLNLSAKYTVGASADCVFPLGKSGLNGRFSASGNYVSLRPGFRTLSGTTVSTTTGGPTLIARSSLSIGPADDRWAATLFIENLNNEQDSPLRSRVGDWQAQVRPRTIGLQLEYGF